MIDINIESNPNNVTIVGILNELDVVEGTTSDGRGYVRATAKIRADQEVNGEVIENEIPVKMFSMRNKKDGSPNQVYDRIVNYKEAFIWAGATEDISQASKVSIVAKVEENSYYDTRTKEIRTGYQFSGSFLNNKKKDDDEGATFEIQGVVGKMKEEFDRDGNETGRLLISFIVVGYGGKANVIELVAEGSKKEFISSHWEEGDTVIATGKVVSSYKTIVTYEEQGFGDPIKRTKTVGRRELLITGGSPSGASEEFSYNADQIKIALQKRSSDLEEMKERTQNAAKAKAKTAGSFLDF